MREEPERSPGADDEYIRSKTGSNMKNPTAVNIRNLQEGDLIGPSILNARYKDLSNATKSIILAERVMELMPALQENGTWKLERPTDTKTVSILADEITNMWPRGADSAQAYTEAKQGFNVLYWGRRFPSGIDKAVTRSSLYADKIFVMNPYIDNYLFHPSHSPLVKPEDWHAVYSANAVFISKLYPWIKAGLVELVPNPGMVNFKLGRALANKAENELVELGPAGKELHEKYMYTATAESFLFMNDKDREQVVKNMGGTDHDIHHLAIEVNKLRAMDPGISEMLQQYHTKLMRSGPGASFATARLMAESLSASIITDFEMHAERIRMYSTRFHNPAQLLSDAFASLNFSFLNNVAPKTAVDMREEGRLLQFRRYLQDLSGLSTLSVASKQYEDKIQSCCDRLGDEYAQYQKEWKQIDSRLAKEAFIATPLVAAGGALLTGAVLTGTIGLAQLGVPCILGKVKSLMDAWTRRRTLSSRPLGVLFNLQA